MGLRKTLCMYFLFVIRKLIEVKERYDFTVKRSVKMLIKQVKQGLNGHTWSDDDLGEREHKPATAELCQKYINHCIRELENWIKNSGEKGTKYHPDHFTNLKGTDITVLLYILVIRFGETYGALTSMVKFPTLLGELE